MGIQRHAGSNHDPDRGGITTYQCLQQVSLILAVVQLFELMRSVLVTPQAIHYRSGKRTG